MSRILHICFRNNNVCIIFLNDHANAECIRRWSVYISYDYNQTHASSLHFYLWRPQMHKLFPRLLGTRTCNRTKALDPRTFFLLFPQFSWSVKFRYSLPDCGEPAARPTRYGRIASWSVKDRAILVAKKKEQCPLVTTIPRLARFCRSIVEPCIIMRDII